MNTRSINIKQIIRIKAVMVGLIAFSMLSAYATMGIYSSGKNPERPKGKLLSQQSVLRPGTFSLKSGYLFRGGQLVTTSKPVYLNLNTVASYQIGKTTYTVPLKKQFLMGKVVINPR
jgi:hypothetical protein